MDIVSLIFVVFGIAVAVVGVVVLAGICVWSFGSFYMCIMGDMVKHKIEVVENRKVWQERESKRSIE